MSLDSRIRQLHARLAKPPGIAGETAKLVQDVLVLFQNVDTDLEAMEYPTPANEEGYEAFGNRELDLLIDLLPGNEVQLLQWARSASAALVNYLQEVMEDNSFDTSEDRILAGLQERASKLSQQVLVELDAVYLRARLDEADQVVQEIKEQAGFAGEAGNFTLFRAFADQELKAANSFRTWSILLISAAVGVATFYAIWEFNHRATEPDWTAVVYRTAILIGIGALSAYLARQAGQHRRLYNWANALEVQLLSFQNFIAPMTDEERHEVRLHFARRVLGSPPDPKKGEPSDDTVPTAQLLDIASAAIRRGSTS